MERVERVERDKSTLDKVMVDHHIHSLNSVEQSWTVDQIVEDSWYQFQ